MLYSIVGIIAVIIDQVVKYWVAKNLFGSDIVIFIPKVISLVNVHNDGAAFSFLSGANARFPFIVITVIFLILVIVALATNFISGSLSRWCLVMIAAGGVGNCIDRVINGYVQDMFKVELFNFPVFNVADIYITVFAIIFIFAMIFERQPEDEPEEEEEPPVEKPAKRRAVKEKTPRMEEPKSLLGRKKAQDEDEDLYEEPVPVRRAPAAPDAPADIPAAPAGRKATPKRINYEEEYARYKAQRDAKEKLAPKSAPAPVRSEKSDDPFAEWAKAPVQDDSTVPGQIGIDSLQNTAPEYSAPAENTAPVKAAPAAAKPAKAADEFSLDDILAEFK